MSRLAQSFQREQSLPFIRPVRSFIASSFIDGQNPRHDDFDNNRGCNGLLHYQPATQKLFLGHQARITLGAKRADLSLNQLFDLIILPDRDIVQRLFAEPEQLHDSDVQFRIHHPSGPRLLWLYFNNHHSGPSVMRAWCLALGA